MSDLISRRDVLDVFRNLAFDHIFQCGEYYGEDERQLTIINAGKAIDVIEALPSAEPERKTGEWVIEEGYDGDEIYQCPFCKAEFVLIDGTPEDNEYEYCPKCGAYLKYVPKPEDEENDEDQNEPR